MAALRWFLFSLCAFGGGAVAAFALHPPALGIPEASAADLRSRLAKIEQYASEGRCDAVKGQLSGAQSTVDKLPANVNVTIQNELNRAISKVHREAISTCLEVAAANTTTSAQAEATTPAPTPEPTATVEPTPEATSPDGGAPDPGTGEGTTPPGPGNNGNGQGNNGNGQGNGGGTALPQGDAGAALQRGLDRAKERYHKAQEQARRELDQLTEALSG